MKIFKTILLLILLVIFVPVTMVQSTIIVQTSNGGEVLKQTLDDDGIGTFNLGNNVNYYSASRFAANGNYTITKLEIYLGINGTPVASEYRMEIWSDTPGEPNVLVSNGASNVFSSLTNEAWNEVTYGTGPSLTNGTRYHVILRDTVGTDSANYVALRYDTEQSGDTDDECRRADNTPTWVGVDLNGCAYRIKIYGT